MEKTYFIKGKVNSQWLQIDAQDQNLGRLASRIAGYLLGKHKPEYTPGVSLGDFVVVVNAEKLSFSQKQLDDKMYYRHSGYPGGLREMSLRYMLRTHPERVLRKAVWGMLPHNRMGRSILNRLKVYSGASHPHEAQKPQIVS